MKLSLVSIIIPVYNVEKYLEKCLHSCINQTYKNIQIICVNNNSTDNSDNILLNYQKKDSRINILQCNIKGPSSSRNVGLQYACGEYIVFLDSDDYITENYIATMYHTAVNYGVDLLSCGIDIYNEKSQKFEVNKSDYYDNSFFVKQHKNIFTQNEVLQDFDKAPIFCYGKIYKNSIIQESKIAFNENIVYNEDVIFNYMYLLNTKYIGFISSKLIIYRRGRKNSIMSNVANYNMDAINSADYIENILKTHNKFDTAKESFYAIKIRNIMMLARKKSNVRIAFYKMAYNSFKNIDIKYFVSNKKALLLKKSYKLYYLKHKIFSFLIFKLFSKKLLNR